ncbi:bifunctional YncE family protein/alkaline phosphatase family protein [Granulicella sp. WH15]|uniref:bifunctional YncE family protein/alkaline phosphatase family protein n=1 Tax=Granulicella sp. WH15 TaxID=2602070 RepID=UPI0013678F2D|nr:bifunctional YncE family protein/alkaline phosphatase family protein [Granulicella sp. WH15]QHN03659.1 bifunctional YncE family protein/alkaline phosphatase family protein [Granulicella sp. WH15]
MRTPKLSSGAAKTAVLTFFVYSLSMSAQTPRPQSGTSSDFNVTAPKDDILDKTRGGGATSGIQSQVDSPNRTVGPQRDGSIVVSDNQVLTPAGRLIELGAPVRAKAIALNPGKTAHTAAVLLMGSPQPIVVFDTQSGQVLQRYLPEGGANASAKERSTGSFAGITYSPDGSRLLFSQDNNYVSVANVDRNTGLLSHEQRVALPPPPADGRAYHNAKSINPGGIAFSTDGKQAYVALNAANTLGVIDLTASPAKLVTQISVGNAPNSVVIHGNFAYISNEGGRPATSDDFTNDSDGTPIVVDRTDAYTITGTVSVVNLDTGKLATTIDVGLHPAGMTVVGSRLFVANAYSDSLSIIDLDTKRVTRTINLSVPIAGGTFGSGPNGVAVTETGTAYVTLGQANAIAVIDLQGRDAHPVIGYIPTAYFPTSIAYDKERKQLVIADDKGLGSRGTTTTTKSGVIAYNTHADMGVVNLIAEPNASSLAALSKQVFENNHWNLTTNIEVGKRFVDPHAKPSAVPKHIGEPSLIKHVFLIIKENRTYDQMLGDVAWGNGAKELAVFASAVPNQHSFVKRFPLLDNVYAPSRQSADGHPWIGMSGSFYSNDILSPDWIRSYPGGQAEDALTNTPKGFLWTEVAAMGMTARLYGEWSSGTTIARKPDGSAYRWADFYKTSLCEEGKAPTADCVVPGDAIHVTSAIPSAAKIMDPHFPPFNFDIPDQYRADYWIKEFKRMDAANQVPNLTILWLPDDHTAGTSKGHPYPINYQADNDLALGRMVEAISHSKIWDKSAIFVEEDDSQAGTDHVDGHRQPVYIISPYTVAPQSPGQGKAIHTTYTAENINRTIENILGVLPLTQFDLVASPMFDAFQDNADLTPYDVIPATVALDQGPDLPLGKSLAYTPVEQQWLKATAKVMKGKYDKADAVDPNFLNHVTWYVTTGWNRPYPGEDKVLAPGPLVKAAMKYGGDDDDDR